VIGTALDTEAELAAAVIDTLLREDYAGLSRQVRATAGGPVLELPGGRALPLRADGFLADFEIARPAPSLTLDDVAAALDGLAGAYAWNISHHGFLMHPPPAFVYL